MAKQLHNKFPDAQIKSLFERYLSKEIEIKYILEILGIKWSRFFELLKEYRNDPDNFSIYYHRKTATREIDKEIEENIIKKLSLESRLIDNKDMPIKFYNYSYIKDQLYDNYGQKVFLPTIIDRAKKNGFYFPRPERKTHDREVLTNYVGELIQHDSSYHKWSPYADEKWYLITSLDYYSRLLALRRLCGERGYLGPHRSVRACLAHLWITILVLCGQPLYIQVCSRQR